jgi:hypothetical protein
LHVSSSGIQEAMIFKSAIFAFRKFIRITITEIWLAKDQY